MGEIWCEVRAQVFGQRLWFRGVVRMYGLATWKSAWVETELEAMRRAEKMAEKLYDENHNVLVVKGTIRSRPSLQRGRNGSPADDESDGDNPMLG